MIELPHQKNRRNQLTGVQERIMWGLYYLLSFGFPAINGANFAVMWWGTGYWYDGMTAAVWFTAAIALPIYLPYAVRTIQPDSSWK